MPFCEKCGAMIMQGQACANPKCGMVIAGVSQAVSLEQAIDAYINGNYMRAKLASIAKPAGKTLQEISAEFKEMLSGRSADFLNITGIVEYKSWHKIPHGGGSAAVSKTPPHTVLMHMMQFIECIENRPISAIGYFLINSDSGAVICPEEFCRKGHFVHYDRFLGLGDMLMKNAQNPALQSAGCVFHSLNPPRLARVQVVRKSNYEDLRLRGKIKQSAFEKYIIHVPDEIVKLSSAAKC